MLTSKLLFHILLPVIAASFLLLSCGGGGEEGDADAGIEQDTAAEGDAHDDAQDIRGDADADAIDLGQDQEAGPACSTMLVENVSSPSSVPTPPGPTPEAGTPFQIPETGVIVTRISEVGDPGSTGDFYTNGYSRWSPSSITGQYVTAFSSDGRASIYRLSDRTIVFTLDYGEPNELHWDSSRVPGTETTIYYRTGAELRKVDILTGADEPVHDFTVEYPSAGEVINGVEGAPSVDMRFWAFQVCTGMSGGGQCEGLIDVIVYDKSSDAIAGRLGDRYAAIPTPNFVDMSPSGSRIVVGSCKEDGGTPPPWNGPYAWSLDFGSNVRLGTNCTHSGWAWGTGGEEYYVSFDSCGASNEEVTETCDHTMVVDVNDPSGWENRIPVFYHGDLGWDNGTHYGRIYDPSVPGWFFVSTYGDPADAWSHQLFFVEIARADSGPRFWRVSNTFTQYDGYWTEAFASLDFQAQRVYWGANWNGADNLELYQAALCDRWWETLGGP
jgi:hypothetical protein